MATSVRQQTSNESFIDCHACDDNDFQLVVNDQNKRNKNSNNKQQPPNNLNQLSSFQGRINQHLVKMVELEKAIFCLIFYLIETYYRPISNGTNVAKISEPENNRLNRENKANQWYVTYFLPNKRIHGLLKAYKNEFEKKFSIPNFSKTVNQCSLERTEFLCSFHRESIDWQLVFASISGFPSRNLAKELNYDSLFDLEDAITQSAVLLSNARKHSDLIDSLILHQQNKGYKSPTTPTSSYNRQQNGCGGADDFAKLINNIEQLILYKKEQIKHYENLTKHLTTIDQQQQHENYYQDEPNTTATITTSLGNWFFNLKTFSSNNLDNKNFNENNSLSYQNEDSYKKCIDLKKLQNQQKELKKEIDSWEEFCDVINI